MTSFSSPKIATAAIINPRSGGGKTGKNKAVLAKKLKAAFGPISLHFTESAATPYHLPAEELTRQAIKQGAKLIIAIGGDGTINEVVNGFFEDGKLINPETELGLLNAGTGGDFRRTFDLPDDFDENLARLTKATSRLIDIGHLSFIADNGEPAERYFANIASFGLSGAVDRAVNKARLSKLFGGRFAFLWATLRTAWAYRAPAVRITTDTGYDETVNVGTAAVANGRFFGGGMMIAPDAKPDDQWFDLVIMRDTRFGDLFKNSGALYDGSHLDDEKVSAMKAQTVEAHPINPDIPVLLDIDGEAPGRLPACFTILPATLKLRT